MKRSVDRAASWRCAPGIRVVAMAAAAILLAACASAGGGAGGPAPDVGTGPTGDQDQTSRDAVWPVKTREHVDLWLHGFALLQEDTTFVPFFKRGYSTNMIVLKNRANVVTQLDANRDRLRAQLAVNRSLSTPSSFRSRFRTGRPFPRRSTSSSAPMAIHARHRRRSRRICWHFWPRISRRAQTAIGSACSCNL